MLIYCFFIEEYTIVVINKDQYCYKKEILNLFFLPKISFLTLFHINYETKFNYWSKKINMLQNEGLTPYCERMEINMKRIINFIVTLVILAAGAYLFPESIYIKDTGALVLTTVFIFLADIVISLIGLGIAFLSLHFDNPVITLCYLILLVIGAFPLSLYCISSLYSGFALNGIWSYIILTFVLFFIFHIDVNKDK